MRSSRRWAGRAPIPWDEKNGNGNQVSPGEFNGIVGNGRCFGCEKPINGRERLYCPTCRQRAGANGWCGCGAALYYNGMCKSRIQRHVDEHREHKKKAKEVIDA
jgi:hypothetical protein